MGCGASVHAQGTLPVPAGSEQEGVKETAKNANPDPLTEEKQVAQVAQEPEVKDLAQPGGGGAQPAAGAPPPAPAPIPSACEPVESQLVQPLSSAQSDAPSSWADELSPCSPAQGPTWSDDPAPDPNPPAQPPGPQPGQLPQPPPKPLPTTSGSGYDATRLVLGASASVSSSAADLELSNPNRSSASLDPAVTPSSSTATVTLLPEAQQAQQGGFLGLGRSRYTDEADLSINSHSYDLDGRDGEDSDDDELAALFTLQSWKRYYNYNKRKYRDLLAYFWRRFPPQDFSCFCISYRDQELLVAPYMAENCIHGYCARLEDLGLASEVFLQMYALHDPELDQYRIVGLLLVAGAAVPPPLVALSAFDGFVYHRADTSRTLIKQFLSALLVGVSPLHSLELISGREVL